MEESPPRDGNEIRISSTIPIPKTKSSRTCNSWRYKTCLSPQPYPKSMRCLDRSHNSKDDPKLRCRLVSMEVSPPRDNKFSTSSLPIIRSLDWNTIVTLIKICRIIPCILTQPYPSRFVAQIAVSIAKTISNTVVLVESEISVSRRISSTIPKSSRTCN